MTTALAVTLCYAPTAHAAPEGGVVTGGVANIDSIGTTTTIQQSSQRAIIRWDSFDVGQSEHVQFLQPSSSSVTVNRIRDTKASQINGRLSANGNIFLINPNGIVFGASSQVDVGGIVASSSDIKNDQAFLEGGEIALTKPGNPNARIVNHGTMTVRDAGLAGLVAPHIENHGVIEAKMGRVQLASGNIATIDLAGDGLIQLQVSDDVLSQSIHNSGTINADGGRVLITAAQAHGMVGALIENTGAIRADTKNGVKGDIALSATGGKITQTGAITARGLDENTSGGNITVLAEQIVLDETSLIDASGDKDGGHIRVGGDYQGGPGLPPAHYVFVGRNAALNARSRKQGDAGSIVLWSDNTTRFYGHADASGNAGLIEVSGKNFLDFDGTVDLRSETGTNGTLLLDPTNITISSGANAGVTVATPYTPSSDNVTSILNISTLLNALNNGNVVVQTRATGAQPGNITVDSAVTWANANKLTLDAHNQIIVNQAIQGGSLHMIAGGDIALNAALAGTGTLTIEQRADNITMGLGGGAGVVNLSALEVGLIQNGWADIILGRETATATMTLNALTWNDNLTLRSGTGTITVAGAQTITDGNDMTIVTDGNINLTAANAITGNSTGTLYLRQASANAAVGFGGASPTGALNITTTEVGRLTNNWADVVIGRADGTGIMTIGATTSLDPLTFLSGTGTISITGVLRTDANDLTFQTNGDIDIPSGSNLLYGSGAAKLTIRPGSVGTGIGLGDGMAGVLNLNTAEINRIRDGWAEIIIGRSDGTANINLGTGAWKDALTLITASGHIFGSGTLTTATNNLSLFTTDGNITLSALLPKTGGVTTLESVNGSVTLAAGAELGAGSLNIISDTPVLGGDISGTGTLSITQSHQHVSMGLGSGQAGDLVLNDAFLAHIQDGWSSRTFGRMDGTGAFNLVGGRSWVDSMVLRSGSGAMNINGSVNMLDNSLTIRTDSNVTIAGDLSGAGTFSLVQSSNHVGMGIGDGQAGTVHLSTEEKGRILNGWGTIVFGRTDSTADLNINAGSWADPLDLRTGTGSIHINGALAMGANNLTIRTDADLDIGASVTGSEYLYVYNTVAATSFGLGDGQAGTIHLSNDELGRLGTTFRTITFGITTGTGDINIGARSWADPLSLRSDTGVIRFNGNQNMAGNALTLSTNVTPVFGGTLVGTGTFSLVPIAAPVSIGLGNGQAGTIALNDNDLAKLVNGWGSLVFGSTSSTGALNVGAYTWNDSLTLRNSTGAFNVNGAQNMGANSLTLQSRANINIAGSLIGTGVLSIIPANNADTMGIGDGESGTIHLSNTELNNIQAGWGSVIIGSTAMTGAMNIGGRTWNNSMDFRTSTGAMNINGAQNMGDNSLTLRTNTNLAIGHILAGTGTLSILPSGTEATRTMGVGDSQSGVLHLSNSEINFFKNHGWSTIAFGNASTQGAFNIGAGTWSSNLILRNSGNATNAMNINGILDVGAHNLSITSNNDIVIGAALNGTGTLSIGQSAATTAMGIGTGQSGTVLLSDTELGRIGAGWSDLVFGTATAITGTHGTMNIGARTWNHDVTFRTLSGVINVNGAQEMGAHDLTFRTSSNLTINAALNGTGTLTIEPAAVSSTMVLNGSGGNLNLTTAELDRIGAGWDLLVFGRPDATGTISVGTRTWANDVMFESGSGIITVAATQMGNHDLIFSTNANLALNGNLTGTGNLVFKNASGIGGIGVGNAQTGVLQLSDAELVRLMTGWNSITFGDQSNFGHVNIGANTWRDPVNFISAGNIVVNGVQTSTSTAATNMVFVTTGGAFINAIGGNTAINPGSGRYLVYSVDQANDTLNGLQRDNVVADESYNSYRPSMVVEGGNVYIYSGAGLKILTLKIDDLDKTYGAANPFYTWSYIGGLQGGDLLNDIVLSYNLWATGSTVLDDAGTVRAINGTFNLGNGYALNLLTGELTVVKADLIVAADANNRVYGEANPSFSVSYSGFQNGEDESVLDALASANSAATALSDAGNHTIIASGGSDDNYNYIYTDGVLTIGKATLTATAQNNSRAYGDADPTFAFTYTGFKNGDNSTMIDVKATGTSSAVANSSVGTYSISGSGAFDNNYQFNYVNGALTVGKAMLTATADNQWRAYGDTNPTLTVSYSGFKNNETSSVINTLALATTGANAFSNAGTYAITATGATADNYDFTYNSGTLTVNKALLTITAQNTNRAYGDANPALSVAYNGFKNGQDENVLTTRATASTAADNFSNVGQHAITATGAAATNYDFSYVDGLLTIDKARLTITAGNTTREYGASNPAVTVSYNGFKNGQDEHVLTTQATATSTANATSNVATYATVASGAAATNYDFTYVDGTLEVTKAMLTATADNQWRTYGDTNPTLTVSYSGFKNNETSSVINTLALASTGANAFSNAGTYAITATGATADNYDFTYNSGTLTVDKALLTITAQNTNRAYGDANPALSVAYNGFKNGQDENVLTTRATASTAADNFSNVGQHAITATGAAATNYDFSYVDGLLTIDKARLTITAGNNTREYGAVNPAFSVAYDGFKNGQDESVLTTLATATSAANGTSNVGAYASVASGAAATNYDFTYVDGTLGITKAMLTATAQNASRQYGESNPAFSVVYSGFKNGENYTVIDTLATASTLADPSSPIGTYTITPFGAFDNNYSFTYAAGALNITPQTIIPPVSQPSTIPPSADIAHIAPATYGTQEPYKIEYKKPRKLKVLAQNEDWSSVMRNANIVIAIADTLAEQFPYVESDDSPQESGVQ